MRVCVIGTGYVGLVTGACLAYIGHDVICVDNDKAKVKVLQSGQSPIFEPGLTEILEIAIQTDRIQFTADLATGVTFGQVLFIAVGTPALPTGESDMRYVEAVARGIGAHLNSDYKVIVNKSTVPIGSGDWVRRLILDGVLERLQSAPLPVMVGAHPSGREEWDMPALPPMPAFDVVSNPEFLREGSAVYDTFNPDRIVLGSHSARAIAVMQELYAPIIERLYGEDMTLPPVPVVVTDLNSAEMVKYAANAFLATKISFTNEIANICERVGADITQVVNGIGLDSRIGNQFLQAGIGWGGSCFPKDVAALIHTAKDYGYEAQLLKASVSVNQRQRLLVVEKLQQVLKVLKGKTIGLLGLTFKPNTDDLRDAPALTLIEHLTYLGAKVRVYDPIVSTTALQHRLPDKPQQVVCVPDVTALAEGCAALVLVTDWPVFRELDYAQMARQMQTPVIIDGRNCLEQAALRQAGFQYVGMGR